MTSRPAHTRGFLFSDLRGYSSFTDRHGDDAARDLLRRYRILVRGVIGTFGGAEIRTEGDSFYVAGDNDLDRLYTWWRDVGRLAADP